jgi:DNA-binding CsgD family transcriptional regulator
LLATMWRKDLLQQLEASGAALAVCDYDGRLVHATPALLAITMVDIEGSALLSAASRLSHRLRDAMRRRPRGPRGSKLRHSAEMLRPAIAVTTRRGTYVLHGVYIGEALLGLDHSLVLVRVDPPGAATCHTPASLRARFRLSAREAQVALLLVDGAGNARIAETLGVTAHTARRHTEHVREKLGAENRAAVARILHGTHDAPGQAKSPTLPRRTR